VGNFKKGSGNLDFGGDDEEDSNEQSGESADTEGDKSGQRVDNTTKSSEKSHGENRSTQDQNTTGQQSDYPYFVRRNNVMDERDTRWELHVRDEVVQQEPSFRRQLANELETDSVSKTDAREFALKFAFENPERVAALMRKEEYGITE
jgi:hypothetical protein